MNYDRILYVKNSTYYFECIDGSKISKVNSQQRKIIIDGLENPNVITVKRINNRIFYYYLNF
jgi:hypothetical protein